MKKILVPTDFSPNADKALNFAVQIAKKAKAKIILVHACDLLDLSFKDNLWLKKEYNNKVIKEAREKLSLYKESVMETENVAIQTKLYEGLITETILYAVKVLEPELIIMGTLGNAGAKERIFGSKTAGIIGKTNVPVLAVPLLSEWSVPSEILLALNNFNEGRPQVIRPAIELATLFGARLTVVKVTPADTGIPNKGKTIEKAGNSYINKVKTEYKDLSIRFVHLTGNNFEKRIETYISKNDMDIVVMLTHKRSFLTSLFNRSLTKKLSYHSKIPLLAIANSK